MKKEFNLLRRYFVAFFFLGFMLMGTNMNAQAYKSDLQKLQYMRAHYVTMQGDYQQGTAKYNYLGDVINYIDSGLTTLNDNLLLPPNFYSTKVWDKADPFILKDRTPEELAQVQSEYDEAVANNRDVYKAELILQANE